MIIAFVAVQIFTCSIGANAVLVLFSNKFVIWARQSLEIRSIKNALILQYRFHFFSNRITKSFHATKLYKIILQGIGANMTTIKSQNEIQAISIGSMYELSAVPFETRYTVQVAADQVPVLNERCLGIGVLMNDPEGFVPDSMSVTFLSSLRMRVQQIFGEVVVSSVLKPNEVVALGELIEIVRAKIDFGCHWYFKKKPNNDLIRSFFVNPLAGAFHVFLKQKGGASSVVGTFKKMTKALVVPFDVRVPARLSAQRVNLGASFVANSRYRDAFFDELKMGGLLGHTPMMFDYFFFNAKRMFDGVERQVVKLTTFEELLQDGHGLRLCAWPEKVQLLFILQLLEGLIFFHDKGYLHGDIKPSNILYHRKGEFVRAVWTDLGMMCPVENIAQSSVLRNGFYGSISMTPPELIFQRPFCGDYFKVESWALGYALFEWFALKRLAFGEKCLDWFSRKAPIPGQDESMCLLEELRSTLVLEREKAFSDCTRANRVLLGICFDFLIVDPSRRISLKDARLRIQEALRVN